MQPFSHTDILAALRRIAARKPRVQCLTNTVAQTLTANGLLAVGADASMATHPGEIIAMTQGAQALLINLGTLDPQREAAIAALLPVLPSLAIPVVLDPVFAQASPLRLALAQQILAARPLFLKANGREMTVLPPREKNGGHIYITTGPVDRISGPDGEYTVARGHGLMRQVTGTGCAAGALIAAFASVTPEPARAAAMALTCLGAAAEAAAKISAGPGTFAANLIDCLANMDEAMLAGIKP
ncbi:MAG: hydroxyethylthiazole kinase [Beijerinckiaceae bacterium]